MSKDEVARYTSQSGSSQAMLNSVMADRLLKRNTDGTSVFDDVATRSPESMSDDLIEKSDLRAYGRQERRHERKEAKHDQVLNDAARLLEGEPPLMAILDASADGKADGRVSERDMRKFLVNYDVNEQTANQGQYPYTQDNREFVQDLLDGKYPHITGSNFTGFSAEALARRAGLDHFIVHNADDYRQLAQMFREKLGTPAEEHKVDNDADAVEPAVDPKPAQKNETDPEDNAKPEPECIENREKATRETFESIKDMCTFRPGEGHWHVAKRLLNAGFPGEEPASNQEIWKLTNALLALSGHTLDERGRPNPMVHPGQLVADFSGAMPEFAKKIPRLAESLHRLHQSHIEKANNL